jgi:hypothetical protein
LGSFINCKGHFTKKAAALQASFEYIIRNSMIKTHSTSVIEFNLFQSHIRKPVTNTLSKNISILTFCLNFCTHNMKLFSIKDVKVLDKGHA